MCKLYIKDKTTMDTTLQDNSNPGFLLKCFIISNEIIMTFQDAYFDIFLFNLESFESINRLTISDCLQCGKLNLSRDGIEPCYDSQ